MILENQKAHFGNSYDSESFVNVRQLTELWMLCDMPTKPVQQTNFWNFWILQETEYRPKFFAQEGLNSFSKKRTELKRRIWILTEFLLTYLQTKINIRKVKNQQNFTDFLQTLWILLRKIERKIFEKKVYYQEKSN